jgi:hypothetical protein
MYDRIDSTDDLQATADLVMVCVASVAVQEETSEMLDDISHSRHLIESMKHSIHEFMHKKEKDEEIRRRLRQCGIRQLQELTNNGNLRNPFFTLMEDAFNLLKCVCVRLERILSSFQSDPGDEEDDLGMAHAPRAHYNELLSLMHQRWCRLRDSFYNAESQTYDTTKVCYRDIRDITETEREREREDIRERVELVRAVLIRITWSVYAK